MDRFSTNCHKGASGSPGVVLRRFLNIRSAPGGSFIEKLITTAGRAAVSLFSKNTSHHLHTTILLQISYKLSVSGMHIRGLYRI